MHHEDYKMEQKNVAVKCESKILMKLLFHVKGIRGGINYMDKKFASSMSSLYMAKRKPCNYSIKSSRSVELVSAVI